MRAETIPHILPLIAFQLGFLSSLTWPGDARATLCRLHTRGDQEKRGHHGSVGHRPSDDLHHIFYQRPGPAPCLLEE